MDIYQVDAHILWERGWLPGGEEARFFTKSGPLSARRLPLEGGGEGSAPLGS